MPGDGYELGIDFGTSNTAAVARWPDGRARPLLFDGTPLLPSAVYAEPGGALVVGRDAVNSSRLDPARFEPNPKRCIDDGTLLLGERDVPVVDVIAAVLARVTDEWRRTVGAVSPRVTLTCPATWGATRRGVLVEAAAQVGFPSVRLVAEPVAAATYFAQVVGREVPVGSVVVVHDLGAGTFDASVVARTSSGFDVLAVDGRDNIGGLDVDAAVIGHVSRAYGDRDPAAWARLATPSTVEDRRAKLLLWEDVRAAKERLSRQPTADLVVPLVDLTIHLTRDELEALAEPLLEQTVRVTQGVIRWANLAPGRLAGVFLVGGSSRIPLMATLLHRCLGEAPMVLEQPELVVAEGSVLAGALALGTDGNAPGPATGMLPRIPVEAWGGAGAPAAPGGWGGSGSTGSTFGESVAQGDPPATLSPKVLGAVEPVSPGAAPVADPVAAPARSIGRVIVPGAQPPTRSRSPAAPVAPTLQLPRVEQPTPQPVSPPARPESPARSAAPARLAAPARSASSPARPYAPRVHPPDARRRPSRLRRFAVRLLVTLLLLAVPIVAALIAYQVTTR